MTDWNLGTRGDITRVALARQIGLDGIQVSLTFPTDDGPHLRDLKTQAAFRQAALENGIQIEACKGGKPSLANFDYAGWTTEANHLGNVAYRVGKKLQWDTAAMKATNAPEADKFIRREYRKGWEGILRS